MKERLYRIVDMLVDYARKKLGLSEKNGDYVRNAVLDILGVAFADTGADCGDRSISELLDEFVSAATSCSIFDVDNAEKYCDAVMGALSLSPQELQNAFRNDERERGGAYAADRFYRYCVDCDYVKKSKLDANPRFVSDGLIITINKAKPEFRDAKKAASGNAVSGGYPSCSICHENEGFGGRAKRTLRTIDITLGGQKWFWQFSPYGYFYQHGIAVDYEHTPMHVDKATFGRLIDFVDMFPQYFIGSNAALPRIGGSVLAHDHYQGGGEVLPLHTAKPYHTITDGRTGATVEILDWQGSAVRVIGDRVAVIDVSERIRSHWTEYDAPELGIIHADGDGVHNAISPTVRKTPRGYEMNIILRSNITSAQYPDGVFHAHPEFHVIKKESIGLIEAQGLFILPGRLEAELGEVRDCIVAGKGLPERLSDYALVYAEISELCGERRDVAYVDGAIKKELGSVCCRILQNTAVFKNKQDLLRFVKETLE